ncbi:MAG: hypothetical protein VKI83_05900 [Synechococcaceae cyanobacterium]|nr:hypothetical protein [Synechococcaceae cyanobacterium]
MKKSGSESEEVLTVGDPVPLSANPDQRDPEMTAPVPWSLAWREDGELAPQDLFDLLQTLVRTENATAQSTLIAAVERLSLSEISVMASLEVTGLCA